MFAAPRPGVGVRDVDIAPQAADEVRTLSEFEPRNLLSIFFGNRMREIRARQFGPRVEILEAGVDAAGEYEDRTWQILQFVLFFVVILPVLHWSQEVFKPAQLLGAQRRVELIKKDDRRRATRGALAELAKDAGEILRLTKLSDIEFRNTGLIVICIDRLCDLRYRE